MSSSTRCTLVFVAAMVLMVIVGASAAYGAAVGINRWVGVLVIAIIAFGAAPDFETGVVAALVTGMACFFTSQHLHPIVMVLPGGMAGFLLIFRAGPLLEWVYPPLGRPLEEDS